MFLHQMRSLLLLLVASFALSFCTDENRDATEADLLGLWLNAEDEENVIRVFEFTENPSNSAQETDKAYLYSLYLYEKGSAADVVQKGYYSIAYGRLVMVVTESPHDPGTVGRMYGNDLISWNSKEFLLGNTSTPSGERLFKKVDAIP